MLWLSLYLPHLSLEAFAGGNSCAEPLLVSDGKGSRRWVHARNRAAAEKGIARGMSLGAALALTKTLRVIPRDIAAERAALEGVAQWAGQFTPTITLIAGRGILLEIEASLALFGGVPALQQALSEGLDALGYHATTAIAPTAEAAWLLSKVGNQRPICTPNPLRQRLGRLPMDVLELEPRVVSALKEMGVQTLTDCLRLPRAGLARRFGSSLLDYLDRLLGRIPDPRPLYEPPAAFASRLLLPSEVDNVEALYFVTHRLLLELAGALRGRKAGILRMELELLHPRGPASRLSIGLVSPSRDPEHLGRLLRVKLEAFVLSAPVEAVTLRADTPVPLAEIQEDLFTVRHSREERFRLVERLQAALGSDAIHGSRLCADHRPERAWARCPPGEQGERQLRYGLRPLWLLERPVPLQEKNGGPLMDGALKLLSGPERIEAGWWEEKSVLRDYFVAEDSRHARYWIFRNREKKGGWFLHGLFA